ncbi:putative nuclease SbcCD D subunit [Vibrio phage pVa-21]|nr:putative nuclease SbcCD D subunit [Vibrio phage pVa-21]
MSDIDALFVSGDLFDRLLNLPTTEVEDINEWTERLLRLSKSCRTPIRILEGTPSHDWKQSATISQMNELYQIGADIMYVEDLAIIEDESLGMTIGYVPDEYRESCEQTTIEFKELMATRGYDKVDMIIMHGMFEYQIPKAAAKSVSHFKEYEWEEMVRHAIIIGHDHRHKSKGKVVVPGSWERLAHNEEDDKGCLVVDVGHDVTDVYHLTNEDAMWHITIDGVKLTDVEVIAKAEHQLHQFARLERPMGRLKVKYNRKYDISARLSEWKKAFTEVIVEGASESDEEIAKSEIDDEFKLSGEAININDENIEGMIMREAEVPPELMVYFQKEIQVVRSAL